MISAITYVLIDSLGRSAGLFDGQFIYLTSNQADQFDSMEREEKTRKAQRSMYVDTYSINSGETSCECCRKRAMFC